MSSLNNIQISNLPPQPAVGSSTGQWAGMNNNTYASSTIYTTQPPHPRRCEYKAYEEPIYCVICKEVFGDLESYTLERPLKIRWKYTLGEIHGVFSYPNKTESELNVKMVRQFFRVHTPAFYPALGYVQYEEMSEEVTNTDPKLDDKYDVVLYPIPSDKVALLEENKGEPISLGSDGFLAVISKKDFCEKYLAQLL